MAFYVQDEWTVTNDFNLTLGIRFDKPLYFDTSEKAQNVIDNACCNVPGIPYVNPNNGETVFIDNTQMPNSDVLISPRLGFNYDIYGDSTFQLWGGTGVFTGRLPFVWIGNQVSSPQVWRTNIGADYKFDGGLILTADVAYTKDINASHV